MKLQNLSLFCLATILALNVANLGQSKTAAASPLLATANEQDSLIGTWHFSGGDLSAQQTIDLALRADGTYTKTLSANVRGAHYGGTHSGTWTASGTVVYLSGDGNWPAVSHDLSRFTRVR